ncbi:MAG: hypothetical protein LBQ68_09200 [Clostridiales bacterium]|jgi:hypothetical protein|nr:hypothetical protein [Clostridiales bacterium]
MADVDDTVNTRSRIRVIGRDGSVTNNNRSNAEDSSSNSVFEQTDPPAVDSTASSSRDIGRMLGLGRNRVLDFRVGYNGGNQLKGTVPVASDEQLRAWAEESSTAYGEANSAAQTKYNTTVGDAGKIYNAQKPIAESGVRAAQDELSKFLSEVTLIDAEIRGALDTISKYATDNPNTEVDESSVEYIAQQYGLYIVEDPENEDNDLIISDEQYGEYQIKQGEVTGAESKLQAVETDYTDAKLDASKDFEAAKAKAEDQLKAEKAAQEAVNGMEVYNALRTSDTIAEVDWSITDRTVLGLSYGQTFGETTGASFNLKLNQALLRTERVELDGKVSVGMNTNGTFLAGGGLDFNVAASDTVSIGLSGKALYGVRHWDTLGDFGDSDTSSTQQGITYEGQINVSYSPTDSTLFTGYAGYGNSNFWNTATAGDTTYSTSSDGGTGYMKFGGQVEQGFGDSGFRGILSAGLNLDLNNVSKDGLTSNVFLGFGWTPPIR